MVNNENERSMVLTDEELAQVTGGECNLLRCPKCGSWMFPEYRTMINAPDVTYMVHVCQNEYCKNEVKW